MVRVAVDDVALDFGRKVLVQRSAADDVQKLHASAGAERRNIRLDGRVNQRIVGDIARLVGLLEERILVLMIVGGINVLAAGHDQRIQTLQGCRRLFFRLELLEIDGFAARLDDGVAVVVFRGVEIILRLRDADLQLLALRLLCAATGAERNSHCHSQYQACKLP